MFYALGAILVLVIGFIWWLFTSVARGARRRDERILAILDPVGRRLAANEAIAGDEIADLARQPQCRPFLYQLLEYFERLDLFPQEYLSTVAQGEGHLAYWLMHPHELRDLPEEFELVETVERELHGECMTYHVYRYRMPSGHWAEKDGWLLGLAGPFVESGAPYAVATAFSRYKDKYGDVQPEELVDWWLKMLKKKGAFAWRDGEGGLRRI